MLVLQNFTCGWVNKSQILLMRFSFFVSAILSLYWHHWRGRTDLCTPLASSFSSGICHELPPFFPLLHLSIKFKFVWRHHGKFLKKKNKKQKIHETAFQRQYQSKVSWQSVVRDLGLSWVSWNSRNWGGLLKNIFVSFWVRTTSL